MLGCSGYISVSFELFDAIGELNMEGIPLRATSLIAGVLAIGTLLPTVAFTAAPPVPKPPAASLVDQLKLTEPQKQKIATLRKTRNQEIAKVLDKNQRQKLLQALKAGSKLSAAMKSLKLKPDQTKKIATIAQKSMQDIKGVLTPDQRKQLESYLKQQKANALPIPVE